MKEYGAMWKIHFNGDGRTFRIDRGARRIFEALELEISGTENNGTVQSWKNIGENVWQGSFFGGTVTLRGTAAGTGLEIQTLLRIDRPFHWRRASFRKAADSAGWGAVPGERLRFFKEGWSMPSPVSCRHYGEREFPCNPDYLRFCSSSAPEYDCETPNRFSGEYLGVLNDAETGESLLAGFVTSAEQITRIRVTLAEQGLASFEAQLDGDGRLIEAGDEIALETFRLDLGDDAYRLLTDFAGRWGTLMHARHVPHAPDGWCSWYYYFEKVTEADIVETVDYLAAHRSEYPLEYLQLDDGYQAALGDWLTTKPEFPHGLRFLAEKISSAGIKPGLWLAPFSVEERSMLYAAHPDWMVHDETGEVAWVATWRGCRVAVLDGTNPEVQEHFRTLFRTLAQIGFTYVKLDFMSYSMSVENARYFDPKATRAQVLRRGLAAIREGFGEERFILGCTVQLGPTVGLVDAERISTDITPYWSYPDGIRFAESPTVPHVCRNLINRCYFNNRLWCNDPDVHIARRDNNSLTEDEVRLWTSALWLVGGMTLLSDRFSTLDPDRAELSRLLLRERNAFEDVHALDLFEREYPSLWFGRRRENGKVALGCFNFAETPAVYEVPAEKLGTAGSFRDHWTGRKYALTGGLLTVSVPPHCCRMLLEE